ncbi:hypothetical protein [Anaerolactibacter massiliensis]|jgi:hypothetical protein|uniref:hypothetical protein n=1 Tax=Anaerolactibacter massiliensis TaxID=2044573 RepID=UPI000CFA0E6A|nr:hypothetical protein [Anaerolactibacter massiliensis]
MKDIFSYNIDLSRNAYLNWRTDKVDQAHNLYVLASDYADGAVSLVNVILEDNRDKKADALIMPIMYCIDQSIEVYLKAIIRRIEMITGDVRSNFKTHDIKELYNALKGHIKKKEVKTSGLQKHLLPLSTFIDELYSKIQTTGENGKDSLGIDFARYPIKADGTPHFYITADENIVIDIENLGRRFIEIRSCLESLYLMYDAEEDALPDQQI